MQMSPILEEELAPSELMKKVQGIFQEHDKNKTGLIIRGDMQKLKEEDFPWSTEQLELLFDGLDSDCQGYLTIQEFIAGLRHVLSSESVTRRHRRRKDALLKGPANLPLEEADIEQQNCFEAFMNQLGADSIFEERVADHNTEVHQLYVEMEQQIEREKRRLQRESEIRSKFYSVEMQKVLDVREREIQHFLRIQTELETEFFRLQEKQHKASTKNQQLKQTNVALENQLQQVLHQLQETQRHLDIMKNRVSQMFKEGGRDRLLEEISSKTPQIPQDETEMVTSELEMNFEYRLSEDILDSSAQQAPEDNALITKAESEPRTRVISIEEDPLAEFIEEAQQRFLQEPLGQSSLLRELNDAIAALNESSESQQEQMHNRGLQRQESSDQMRQHGNKPHYITQGKIPQYEGVLRNDGPGKRILETDQGTFQQEILRKGQSYVQDDVLEMGKTGIFEPRLDLKGLVPMQTVSLFSEGCSPGHSKLASQVIGPKESPEQEDILSLGQVAQPKFHKQVLKTRERIQTQWPSVDSEQGVRMKTSIKMDKGIPSVKGMLPACFSPRTVLRKWHNSQLENMSKSETRIQTLEEREELLTEDRKEGQADISECEKDQEARIEMDKETNVNMDYQDCQVNAETKETSKGTADVCPHPDHLYNLLFVGDSNVGKTTFLCGLHDDSFGSNITATIGMDYRIKNLFVDNKCFTLRLWDTAGQERYHSVTKQFFRKADGVVLMYDITSENSFADVRYWLNCIQINPNICTADANSTLLLLRQYGSWL
uniref:ras-related protein Rab-44 n=1 Tax=Euleptes europaea TaxID=460621 RepID=UPI00254146CF|nr:ras-related protein Rab-44 [Euleptes europaea]